MGKANKTKAKILKLISKGYNTEVELRKQLNLATSTVSQHLRELMESQLISQIPNEHIKKWKYYKRSDT